MEGWKCANVSRRPIFLCFETTYYTNCCLQVKFIWCIIGHSLCASMTGIIAVPICLLFLCLWMLLDHDGCLSTLKNDTWFLGQGERKISIPEIALLLQIGKELDKFLNKKHFLIVCIEKKLFKKCIQTESTQNSWNTEKSFLSSSLQGHFRTIFLWIINFYNLRGHHEIFYDRFKSFIIPLRKTFGRKRRSQILLTRIAGVEKGSSF